MKPTTYYMIVENVNEVHKLDGVYDSLIDPNLGKYLAENGDHFSHGHKYILISESQLFTVIGELEQAVRGESL